MGRSMMRSGIAFAMAVALLGVCAPARADWSGDGGADILAIDGDERLLMYRGDGAGGLAPDAPQPVGTGWGTYDALLAPGDLNGRVLA